MKKATKEAIRNTLKGIFSVCFSVCFCILICYADVWVVGLWLEAQGILSEVSEQSLYELFYLFLGILVACIAARGLFRATKMMIRQLRSVSYDPEEEEDLSPKPEHGQEN